MSPGLPQAEPQELHANHDNGPRAIDTHQPSETETAQPQTVALPTRIPAATQCRPDRAFGRCLCESVAHAGSIQSPTSRQDATSRPPTAPSPDGCFSRAFASQNNTASLHLRTKHGHSCAAPPRRLHSDQGAHPNSRSRLCPQAQSAALSPAQPSTSQPHLTTRQHTAHHPCTQRILVSMPQRRRRAMDGTSARHANDRASCRCRRSCYA